MATIKIRWTVDELANVLTLFNTQKVFRSTAGPEGPWVEITAPLTRIPLVAGVTSYLYDDTTGDPTYYYAVAYFHSGTTLQSNLSDPMRGDLAGYLTVEEVRDEGFTAGMVSDVQIIRGIERASSLIDRVTRQWFQPRTRTWKLDSRGGTEMLLQVPIIAITEIKVADEVQDLTEFLIYNRHLTQGLLAPDDRMNPRIAWGVDDHVDIFSATRSFPTRRQGVQISGVFGFTELAPTDVPGETVPGNQVPTSYGRTPELLKSACLLLTIQYMYPIASGEGLVFSVRRRVVEERTRDQNYRLSDASSWNAQDIFGMTGDMEVDQILTMFMAPLNVGAV